MARAGARPSGCVRQVLVVLLLTVLVACGGEGDGGGAPSPTRTPTADRTVERPTDRPTGDRTDTGRTDEPTPDETEGPTPDETAEPTPDRPTPTRDLTDRPEDPSTDEAPTTLEPSPTSEAADPPATVPADDVGEDEGDSVPSWVWWLLGALLLAAVVAVPLIVRSRRHAAWRRDLAHAEGEIVWFARELLRELRHAHSPDEVAGGWTVGQPRVVTAEDRLAVLEASAPNQTGRDRTRVLLDASRQARAAMQALTGPGPHDTWMLDLDTVMDDLEHALAGRGAGPSSPPPA